METEMKIFRWLIVMYDRKIYRKSREFKIEQQCQRLERKWKSQYEPTN